MRGSAKQLRQVFAVGRRDKGASATERDEVATFAAAGLKEGGMHSPAAPLPLYVVPPRLICSLRLCALKTIRHH
jgi:hypothetical protein